MNTAPIGILDSGSGGLSIQRSVLNVLPRESYVYIGDHKFLPYGTKPPEVIQERVLALIHFLVSKGSKLVVVACNTATIAGIGEYRNRFPGLPIVGVVPVVKTAAAESRTQHVVVLSTEFTAESQYQKELIEKFSNGCEITSIGSSKLVPLIESGHPDDKEITEELRELFQSAKHKPFDVVVLGCTHYSFIRHAIEREVGPNVEILDSAGAVARQVTRVLTARNELSDSGGPEQFFTTGDPEVVEPVYNMLLERIVKVTHVRL